MVVLLENNIAGFLLNPTLKYSKEILRCDVLKQNFKETCSGMSVGVTLGQKIVPRGSLGTLDDKKAKQELTQIKVLVAHVKKMWMGRKLVAKGYV